MRLSTITFLLCFTSVICGCSNKQVYQSIQNNSQAECDREPNQDARLECQRGLGQDYQSYKRNRQELIEEEHQ